MPASLIAAAALFASGPARGNVTVTYLGQDTTTAGGWRTAGSGKATKFDPNGDGIYGTDGYSVLYGNADPGNVANVAASLPAWISSVTWPNTKYQATAYGAIDDPGQTNGANFARTGITYVTGTNPVTLATLQVASTKEFILGVIVNTHDNVGSNLSSITLAGTGYTSVAYTLAAPTTSAPRYAFFQIKAAAGDTIQVKGTSSGSEASATGIFFEALPAITLTGPADNQTFLSGSPVTVTAAVAGGAPNYSVTYRYKPSSAASYTDVAAVGPFDGTNAFTKSLGTLPDGEYQLQATMTDSATGSATSLVRNFSVSSAIPSLASLKSTAPTAGANDIAQLGVTGNKTAPDGLNYFTDNQTALNTGEPGQTFTTGSNAAGYTLNSVSLMTSGLGSFLGIGTPQPYVLHLYSVSGGTATRLRTYTSANLTFMDGDWLRWSGLALTLNPNAQYAWSFGKASTITSYEALAVAADNPYAGGEIGLFPPAGGAITRGAGHGFDAVFALGLTPVNVPSINRITVSPGANVTAGTPVSLAAETAGAAPLQYQWQFDSGAGYADIPGANGATLNFTATVAAGGSYRLALSNSFGSVTSAPVVIGVTTDTTPPVVVRVFNTDATHVQVDFSKQVDAATATNPANYGFLNGPAILSIALLPDNASVLITTAPITYGGAGTLTIHDVRDRALPANTIAAGTQVGFTPSPRARVLLDAGWKFQIGDPADVTNAVTIYPEIGDLTKLQPAQANMETALQSQRPDPVATHAGEGVSFVANTYDDGGWRALNLPHDWAVELPFTPGDVNHGSKATGGSTIGWYRRTFALPASDAGKVLRLEFDGIYRNALVWFNGHCVGRSVSGYAPISFDVTPYANPGGDNVLVVRVDASRDEGWFYQGAGIYRHVWMTKTEPLHVAQWGTFVSTTAVTGGTATITVKTTVANKGTQAVTAGLTSTIQDADGNPVTAATSPVSLAAGQEATVTQTLTLANAKLWSLQSPYLYNLASSVSNGSTVTDLQRTPFGVRTVSFDAAGGFFLNGERVEIRGMCNHQDHAGVGAALPDRLQYFRIERLKQMGVNTYRCSHNAATPELLDACDRLGMLVLAETRRFGSDAESLGQLERMVRRDRNHPGIFCWSMANEEVYLERDSVTGGSIMQAMVNLTHQLDPSRKCTAGMDNFASGAADGFSPALDVQGFNYFHHGNIDAFHNANPNLPSFGTEEASTFFTRGVYSNTGTYQSAYDVNAPGYCATAEDWLQFYAARPWLGGGCAWTGFDYRGEPTPYGWPNISSQFGIMDTCGFPKDAYYYYQANWSLKPVLHILPHWNWTTPGQPVNIWTFGNCQSVELFLNDVSLGKRSLNVLGHAEWNNVPYAPGTLRAVGYNNGVQVVTDSVATTGPPAAITLLPDRRTILADGRDVSMVTVAVVDAQGRIVPTASNNIAFELSEGEIIGVGNGDPASHEADKATRRSVFNGLAQVIVQSTARPGSITLKATSGGLTPAIVTLTEAAVLPPPDAPAAVAALGGDGQVAVSWDIVPGATTYDLWRATTPGGPYTLVAGDIGGVSLGYTDRNLTNLSTYYYVVSAKGAGTSAKSAEVQATPQARVTGLTAVRTGSQVALNWNAVAGSAYNVKRSTTSGGPYTTIATAIGGTSYTDTAAEIGRTNYYVVTLTNGVQEGLPSAEAAVAVPGPLPAPFKSTDVGAVGVPGAASSSDGQYSISGSGSDMWATADMFHFDYIQLPPGTNCDIRARILSLQNTDDHAKTGVIIRESLSDSSRHAMVDVTPGAGIEFLWRAVTGGNSASSIASGGQPAWVRLTRSNNTFTGYLSADGNTWTQIGSPVTITMTTGVYVGIAVCSHNNAVAAAALVDNVSITFPPGVGYSTWAASNAGGQGTDLDANHNGLANGIEYFMGATSANPGTMPGIVNAAGSMSWTWPYDPTAAVTYKFQLSNDLSASGWVDIVAPDQSISVLTNPNRVRLNLPSGTQKKFCRLVVTPLP